MVELAFPFVIIMILIVAEAIFLQKIKKATINWPDIIFNLNSGHLMLWFFRGFEVFCYHFIYTHFSFNLFVDVPVILIWIFTLFAWDFGFYWEHRLHHTILCFAGFSRCSDTNFYRCICIPLFYSVF